MKKLLSLLFLLVLHPIVNAQPGGPGGFTIQRVYTSQLNEFPSDNPDYSFRVFVMNGAGRGASVNHEYQNRHTARIYPDGFEVYLGPNEYKDWGKYERGTPPYRIYLREKKKLMVIDVKSLTYGNGDGSVDKLDSIVFAPGYFIFDGEALDEYEEFGVPYSERLISRGITPSTLPVLLENDILRLQGKADDEFLNPRHYSANWYFWKAHYALEDSLPEKAIEFLEKAKPLVNNKEEAQAYTDLTQKAWFAAGEYAHALEEISSTIEAENNASRQFDNLHHRINLAIQLKNYALADSDYVKLGEIIPNHYQTLVDRSTFRVQYQYNLKGAKADLLEILDNYRKSDNAHFHLEDSYAAIHIQRLALAEYGLGELDSAARHFLRAADWGHGYGGPEVNRELMREMMEKHPDRWEFRLAFAIYQEDMSMRRYEEDREAFAMETLKLFEDLEKSGVDTSLIHLYKGKLYHRINQREKALEEAKMAAEMDPNDARNYKLWCDIGCDDAIRRKYHKIYQIWSTKL